MQSKKKSSSVLMLEQQHTCTQTRVQGRGSAWQKAKCCCPTHIISNITYRSVISTIASNSALATVAMKYIT